MLFDINCRLLFAALVSFQSSFLIVVSVSLDAIFPLIYRRINIVNCFIAANRCNQHHHCLPRAIHIYLLWSQSRGASTMIMYEWTQTNSASAAASRSRTLPVSLRRRLRRTGASETCAYSASSIRRHSGHLWSFCLCGVTLTSSSNGSSATATDQTLFSIAVWLLWRWHNVFAY